MDLNYRSIESIIADDENGWLAINSGTNKTKKILQINVVRN